MEQNAVIDSYEINGGYGMYATKDKHGRFKTYPVTSKSECYDLMHRYGNTHNNYLSSGIYKTPWYKGINVKEMKCLYIDIDTSRHLYKPTKEELRTLANAILECEELPEPSIIVFSGHGLQILYRLKNANDIPLWKCYESTIVKRFEYVLENIRKSTLSNINDMMELSGIHVDTITDENRVLRVPDTANVKYEPVMAETFHNSHKVYTLDELKKYDVFSNLVSCTPYNALRVTETDLRKLGKKELNKTLKGTNEKLKYFLETRIMTRLDDLETLIQVRNKKGVTDGYRNNLIAIYLTTLVNLGYKRDEIIHELERVNDTFKEPLSQNELYSWINSGLGAPIKYTDDEKKLKRTYYKYTTKKIIDKLDITEDEQEYLKIFINRRIRNKRDYAKNGAKYKAQRRKKYAQATESKRKDKEKRNKEVIELSKQGLTQREIASKYGIAQATVFKILKSSK